MITFFICIVLLIAGYFVMGKITEKNFGPDNRETPAIKYEDGVDFVPMPTWRIFLIQLLNIAGLGPILGALNGALFGPIVYLWIVLGTIFGGGVHDYMSGMMSIRNKGASITEIVGKYLGNFMLNVMRGLSIILCVMVGVVFSKGPAGLIALLTPEKLGVNFWLVIIVVYYFIATFIPIDKIIGKYYPIFGTCLIIMAIGVAYGILFSGNYEMPELWNNFTNWHPSGTHVWPYMFLTVACGAVSGFHATQSPLMARCCKSELVGQKVFYGAMVAEGIIALIWAAAGVSFYENAQALLDAGAGVNAVVYEICKGTMGKIGGVIAMLGVIACPISSGDTAYRSARLMIADWFGIDQKDIIRRLMLSVVVLGAGIIIGLFDYSIIWRYFTWANQTLAMITLWTASVYLYEYKKNYIIAVIPAVFMTGVTSCYFFSAPECLGIIWNLFGVPFDTYYVIALGMGFVFTAVCLGIFIYWLKKYQKKGSKKLA